MLDAGKGLTGVTTDDLTLALRMLVRGELSPPLGIADLARVGLQHCSGELLGAMRGLETRAVQAVLVNVLAERTQRGATRSSHW